MNELSTVSRRYFFTSLHHLLSVQKQIMPISKSVAKRILCLPFYSGLEKYGSGIGRVINYFKESNMPLPTFENHSGGFLVTVFASDNREPTENVTENVTENRTQYILEAIRNNPTVTTVMLSQQLNIARMTLHRDLEKLKKEGIIKRIGPAKGGYWQIIE